MDDLWRNCTTIIKLWPLVENYLNTCLTITLGNRRTVYGLIFVIDFLKDFCYAKFISKTLLLRNYVQVQPHPTGATKIKLLHSFRTGELRFFLPIHRSVTDWKNLLTTFFFFPAASWLINDGVFPSETPVTGVNVSFSCMNFLVSWNCQIT